MHTYIHIYIDTYIRAVSLQIAQAHRQGAGSLTTTAKSGVEISYLKSIKQHISLTTIAKSVSAPRADVQTNLNSPKNPKSLTNSR
jgi:hypothetical protein